jgi:hypothetical protein
VEAPNNCASSCSGANCPKLQLQGTWCLGPSIVTGASGWSTATTRATHVNELFAVHSLGEIRAVMEAISLQNTGNLGEQIAKRRAA